MDLGPVIWALSETQLSLQTFQASRQALIRQGKEAARNVKVLAGAPAPLQSNSSWPGARTGVLTMSDWQCRALMVPWPTGHFSTAVAIQLSWLWQTLAPKVQTLQSLGMKGVRHGSSSFAGSKVCAKPSSRLRKVKPPCFIACNFRGPSCVPKGLRGFCCVVDASSNSACGLPQPCACLAAFSCALPSAV